MLHDCKQETVNIIQLGRLKTSEVNQVLFLANQIQKTFIFDFKSDKNLILNDSFKLPNGGFDLCKAIKQNIRKNRYNALSKPIIFITEDPFGSPEHASEPGWFFFSSQENDYDKKISIISTQPLEALPKQRTLQSYLFMMFATFILTTYGELAFHSDLRGCPLDFCDELKDAENCLRYGRICEECERILQTKLRQKLISLEKIGAAIRLLNRSVSRKYCFVLMPFNDKFNKTYETIRQALSELGWDVKRADEIAYPRLITERILREILTSDLVIADLTDFNPNVFYEVGITHMVGNDILFISQDRKVPFDIANEQAIFYKIESLDNFKIELKSFIGSALS